MKDHIGQLQSTNKRNIPVSGLILVVLLLSTFLTVLVTEQQQKLRSNAAPGDTGQQACLPSTGLDSEAIKMLEPFCEKNVDAGICKDFCKRGGDTASGSASGSGSTVSKLCQPGGAYHCEAASGQPAKGKCQQGTCATAPRTGTDTYCGGGQSCCNPAQPLGGTCTKKEDCDPGANLECSGGKCTRPVNGDCTKKEDCSQGSECTNSKCTAPPVQPGGNPNDRDGDGIPNDKDTEPDKKAPVQPGGTPNDRDGDGVPNDKDTEPDNKAVPSAGAPSAAPSQAGACQNAVGLCRSGCINSLNQCCKTNKALTPSKFDPKIMCCGAECAGPPPPAFVPPSLLK